MARCWCWRRPSQTQHFHQKHFLGYLRCYAVHCHYTIIHELVQYYQTFPKYKPIIISILPIWFNLFIVCSRVSVHEYNYCVFNLHAMRHNRHTNWWCLWQNVTPFPKIKWAQIFMHKLIRNPHSLVFQKFSRNGITNTKKIEWANLLFSGNVRLGMRLDTSSSIHSSTIHDAMCWVCAKVAPNNTIEMN